MLPGKTVREVIPFDNYLLYFSHGLDKSYLYIADSDGECVSKIIILIDYPDSILLCLTGNPGSPLPLLVLCAFKI